MQCNLEECEWYSKAKPCGRKCYYGEPQFEDVRPKLQESMEVPLGKLCGECGADLVRKGNSDVYTCLRPTCKKRGAEVI